MITDRLDLARWSDGDVAARIVVPRGKRDGPSRVMIAYFGGRSTPEECFTNLTFEAISEGGPPDWLGDAGYSNLGSARDPDLAMRRLCWILGVTIPSRYAVPANSSEDVWLPIEIPASVWERFGPGGSAEEPCSSFASSGRFDPPVGTLLDSLAASTAGLPSVAYSHVLTDYATGCAYWETMFRAGEIEFDVLVGYPDTPMPETRHYWPTRVERAWNEEVGSGPPEVPAVQILRGDGTVIGVGRTPAEALRMVPSFYAPGERAEWEERHFDPGEFLVEVDVYRLLDDWPPWMLPDDRYRDWLAG